MTVPMIKSIGGNPIVPSSVEADSIADTMLKQTGGVLDSFEEVQSRNLFNGNLTITIA